MNLICLDFETHFSDEYTLKKLTTESYIRDPRFEALGVSVLAGGRIEWYGGKDRMDFFFTNVNWANTAVIAHHAQFDGFILNHHFGVRPAFWFDTLSMARMVHGNHLSVGLESLARHYNLAAKSVPYDLFRGKRWADLDGATRRLLGEGCNHDVELTYAIFGELIKVFPREELAVIDATIRMFTEPVLEGDAALFQEIAEDEAARKNEILHQLGVDKTILSSNDKFASLLESLGVEVPVKKGKNGLIPAVAAKDQFMMELLNSEDTKLAALANARCEVRSSINETRAGRLAGMAGRGPLAVYLSYCGAHTTRWGGGDKINFQNLTPALRAGVRAPDGFLFCRVDQSQGECIAHGQLVLTARGPVAIQDVELDDLVFDGVEFVQHEGVICKGLKEVISYQGLTATPDHVVYVRRSGGEARVSLLAAAEAGENLWKPSSAHAEREEAVHKPERPRVQIIRRQRDKISISYGYGGSALDFGEPAARELPRRRDRPLVRPGAEQVAQAARGEETRPVQKALVYDIVNAGPRHRFVASGAVVSNCRILNWLAGQEDVLERFRLGHDPYLPMASSFYGREITKADKAERQTGKVIELAAGFGMGAIKLKASAAARGVAMTDTEALHGRDSYRATHPRVVALWKDGDQLLIELSNKAAGLWHGFLFRDGLFFLPNGAWLDYTSLEWHVDEQSGEQFWRLKTRHGYVKYYGAKAVQNIVQALSRVVTSQAMLRAREKGYRIVGTAHDDFWALIPEENSEAHAQFLVECMRAQPSWAPGLPLDAEAHIGRTYG